MSVPATQLPSPTPWGRVLETINSGTFLDSNAGRYLRPLSDRFAGEALVDMLCLLRLHGELAELQRSIGKTGMLMLRPLMMASGKDMWQLRLLGK